MAATKTKSASKKSSSTSKSSGKKSAAQNSAAKARSDGATGSTRKSDLKSKTKQELFEDAIRRPAQPNIDQEIALSDVEKFARDNPGVRAPDNSRRTLPVEEFPKDDPVRKAREKAVKVIKKALEDLGGSEADLANVDPVLGDAIRVARRHLRNSL